MTPRSTNPVINAVIYALIVLGCVTRKNAAALLSLTTVNLTTREKGHVLAQFPEQCPGPHAGGPCGPGCGIMLAPPAEPLSEREEQIAGIREMLDWMANHPSVPIGPIDTYGHQLYCSLAQLLAIAEEIGAEPKPLSRHVEVEGPTFRGGMCFRVCAIDAADEFKAMLQRERQLVDADDHAEDQRAGRERADNLLDIE